MEQELALQRTEQKFTEQRGDCEWGYSTITETDKDWVLGLIDGQVTGGLVRLQASE